jgi:hypothetical protein
MNVEQILFNWKILINYKRQAEILKNCVKTQRIIVI